MGIATGPLTLMHAATPNVACRSVVATFVAGRLGRPLCRPSAHMPPPTPPRTWMPPEGAAGPLRAKAPKHRSLSNASDVRWPSCGAASKSGGHSGRGPRELLVLCSRWWSSTVDAGGASMDAGAVAAPPGVGLQAAPPELPHRSAEELCCAEASAVGSIGKSPRPVLGSRVVAVRTLLGASVGDAGLVAVPSNVICGGGCDSCGSHRGQDGHGDGPASGWGGGTCCGTMAAGQGAGAAAVRRSCGPWWTAGSWTNVSIMPAGGAAVWHSTAWRHGPGVVEWVVGWVSAAQPWLCHAATV